MASVGTLEIELTTNGKGTLVEALWHAVDDATGNLRAVPGLVKQVIITEAWRKRTFKGKCYEHTRFIDFITTKPLAGCGWPADKVEALIKDDAEALALWRQATTAPVGTNQHSDNVTTLESERGNSRSYTLDRLKRERSDLFERVVAGELSANAAAIEAGFRRKSTPYDRLISAWRTANDQERAEFLETIGH